jgi:virginiamycin B lyase
MKRSFRSAWMGWIARGVRAHLPLLGVGVISAACGGSSSPVDEPLVEDYPLSYSGDEKLGSTHEITYNSKGGNTFWVTGQAYDSLVEIGLDGTQKLHAMPAGSSPHGVVFDATGNLYVSFQYEQLDDAQGQIARLDPETGEILKLYDVNADPHGMSIGPDGSTLWFTGKMRNVIGRLSPEGALESWPIPPMSSPIYIHPGPDGNMWFTELMRSNIGRITPNGAISEFPTPTMNSRPIAIVADPDGGGLWFSEEAGNNVARIDLDGTITEYPVPKTQENVILAALSFDSAGNLWVQQYVDQNKPSPAGDDHIIKIDKAALRKSPSELQDSDFTFYKVPTRQTILHRIVEGPDGNMWFTELKVDKVGRVLVTE